MEAFREEHKVLVPFLEEVPGSGHLRLTGVFTNAGKVYFLFLHVIAQTDVVEVRGDVDQSVGHDHVSVPRQNFIQEELKPADKMVGSGNKAA